MLASDRVCLASPWPPPGCVQGFRTPRHSRLLFFAWDFVLKDTTVQIRDHKAENPSRFFWLAEWSRILSKTCVTQPPTQSLRATTMRGPTRTHLGTFTCLLALPSSVATLGCSSVAHRGALGLEVHTLASSSLVEAWLEYTYVCEKL